MKNVLKPVAKSVLIRIYSRAIHKKMFVSGTATNEDLNDIMKIIKSPT